MNVGAAVTGLLTDVDVVTPETNRGRIAGAPSQWSSRESTRHGYQLDLQGAAAPLHLLHRARRRASLRFIE